MTYAARQIFALVLGLAFVAGIGACGASSAMLGG